jgi:hypothetical protein
MIFPSARPSPPHHFSRFFLAVHNASPSKPRVLMPLRSLFLSLRSFRLSPRLFSVACGLFLQNTGGGGTSATSPRPPRLCVIICRYLVAPFISSTYKSLLVAHRFATFSVFMHLQIPFSATSLYSHLYKTPGCHPTSQLFHRRSRPSSPEIFLFLNRVLSCSPARGIC